MKTSFVGCLALLVLALVAGADSPSATKSSAADTQTGEETKAGPDLTVIYSMANLGYIEPCG